MKTHGQRRNVPSKIIDTWVYKVKDVDRQDVVNKTISMQVELHKRTTQSEEPPHPTSDVHFEVYCKECDLRMTGTDIESLRQVVWSVLDKKFDIKWDPYFLVEVKPVGAWGLADGTGLEFTYKNVYKGTTWDGKNLLKIYTDYEFEVKPWPGEFTNQAGRVIACIPDTDLNRKALEEFCRRIDVMRDLMSDYLKPETIMQTLADLSGAMPFLPASAEKASSEESAADCQD